MDQVATTTVSSDQSGVSAGAGMAGGNGRDAQYAQPQGDADFERRVQELVRPYIEKTADGFRSTVDKRLTPFEQQLRAVPQIQGQLTQLQQQLNALLNQRQAQEEEGLEPEEKQKRQFSRQFEQLQSQLNTATSYAAGYYNQNQVLMAAAEFGIKWGDPDVNWQMDLFNANPTAWTAAMSVELARVARQRDQQRAEREREEARRYEEQRAEAARRQADTQAQRQQAEQRNQQQVGAVQRFSGVVPEPGTTEKDAMSRLQSITDPKERRRKIEEWQKAIRRGETDLSKLR